MPTIDRLRNKVIAIQSAPCCGSEIAGRDSACEELLTFLSTLPDDLAELEEWVEAETLLDSPSSRRRQHVTRQRFLQKIREMRERGDEDGR